MTKAGTPGTFTRPSWRRDKKQETEDDDHRRRSRTFWKSVASAALPSWTGICLKTVLGVTVALYVLNQSHMLPKPLSAVVSKTLFWPTLPITVGRRIGQWSTVVDDTVIMGGCPFGFARIPDKLRDEYGVRGVINMCAEWQGPLKRYKLLGMQELHLPTVDHCEPRVQDLETAVQFIQKHQSEGKRVYVHCRAGHGRSAAVVFAWLLSKDPYVDRRRLNQEFCRVRHVRKTLWKQSTIAEFHDQLVKGRKGSETDNQCDENAD